MDIVGKRLARRRRAALVRSVHQARKEFKSGKLHPATPSEIVRKVERETLASPLGGFSSFLASVCPKASQLAEELQLSLERLAEDAFHPQLKTHKLKGKLAGSVGMHAGYDLRIAFQFVKHRGEEPILAEAWHP